MQISVKICVQVNCGQCTRLAFAFFQPPVSKAYRTTKKLDDGWPESVEEQGLLLLVWRHNFTNNIWKMCYRQSRRGVARQNSEKCKTIVCIANTFTHRRFYTQKLLHTEAFTQRLLHTKLLPTEAFTYRRFYTQMFLHTDAFTRTLLQIAPDDLKSQFYLSFWRSNLISCERVARDKLKSQFYLSFCRSNLISCERVAPDDLKSQFYLSFGRSNLISCERVARDKLKS